jgi:hypothetical protein
MRVDPIAANDGDAGGIAETGERWRVRHRAAVVGVASANFGSVSEPQALALKGLPRLRVPLACLDLI